MFFCVKQDRAVVKWCRDALVKYASLQTLWVMDIDECMKQTFDGIKLESHKNEFFCYRLQSYGCFLCLCTSTHACVGVCLHISRHKTRQPNPAQDFLKWSSGTVNVRQGSCWLQAKMRKHCPWGFFLLIGNYESYENRVKNRDLKGS